ncbi:DNA-directed RNA polymerases IV and V subunit 4 isoform X3 [Ziziphus jujuba]|uniref:DNA-directed RNA polymerases IV and V subunit 4 isoform X3 n=1 Tax=Ziziphus jujuba TaxID=326968 RepID=A0ABM4ADC1_ZIZJJ|nr:DNA-directed RNA polymerases IV and V subunit 4 isoform X3 [Ziziphus jujuba]XP_060674738.1 DNA-directed RNA polymerases IV and V subunit 4 isoform X3 [Ziziphus jujuba]
MRYLVMKFGGQITYSRTVVEVEAAAMELLKTVEAKNREVGEWRPTFKKGKGDKVASGGKGSVTKVPQPLELRIEQGRSFDKGLQYAKRGRHYTHTQSIRRSLETLTKYGVTDGEMCVIANVCPDTVDEAFALILSLKQKRLFHKSDPSKVSDTYLNMLCKIF